MSHISRIRTKLTEKEYLLQALSDLGYPYEEGIFSLSGFSTENFIVDIKIKLRLSSDIGFRKLGDYYDLVADWWGVRNVTKQKFLAEVTQRYAYHAARAKLEAQGFNLVDEEIDQKGGIRLILRRVV
jgi:hypothetical protein